MTSEQKQGFDWGVACAAATIWNAHGEDLMTKEILSVAGLNTLEKLKEAGVDENDLETLAGYFEWKAKEPQ